MHHRRYFPLTWSFRKEGGPGWFGKSYLPTCHWYSNHVAAYFDVLIFSPPWSLSVYDYLISWRQRYLSFQFRCSWWFYKLLHNLWPSVGLSYELRLRYILSLFPPFVFTYLDHALHVFLDKPRTPKWLGIFQCLHKAHHSRLWMLVITVLLKIIREDLRIVFHKLCAHKRDFVPPFQFDHEPWLGPLELFSKALPRSIYIARS